MYYISEIIWLLFFPSGRLKHVETTNQMGSIGFSRKKSSQFVHDPPSPAQQNQSIHSHFVTHVGKEAANLMWFLRNVHGNEKHFLGG